MQTIKIIDLLVKMANCEDLPEKIRYDEKIFILDKLHNLYRNSRFQSFGFEYNLDYMLNKEVEIIEDTPKEVKIPEKLDYCEENTFMNQKEPTYLSQKERILLDSNFKELGNIINSIIDYLKSKGE